MLQEKVTLEYSGLKKIKESYEKLMNFKGTGAELIDLWGLDTDRTPT